MMIWLRILLVACLGWLSACSSSINGVVYYDNGRDGVREDNAFGVAGIPVELYDVTGLAPGQTASNASPTPTASSPNPALSPNTAKAAQVNLAILGKAAETKDAYATPTNSPTTTPTSTATPTPSASASTPVDTSPDASISGFTPATVPSPRGRLIASILTDKHGAFRFDSLPGGDYEVRLANSDGPLAHGFQVTTGRNPVDVTMGVKAKRVEFGVFRVGLAEIARTCDTKWPLGTAQLCELTLRNEAPTALQNITLSLTLPNHIERSVNDDATPNHGALNADLHAILWQFAHIAPGEIVRLSALLVPKSGSSDDIGTTSLRWKMYSAELSEPLLLAAQKIEIQAIGTLSASLQAPTHADAAATISLTTTITNTSGMPFKQVVVHVQLPEDVTFDASVNPNLVFDSATHVVEYQLALLPSGANASRVLAVQLPNLVAAQRALSFAATVHADDLASPVASNNVMVQVQPNLHVTITGAASPLTVKFDQAGDSDRITWNMQLTLIGAAELHNVVLTATIDERLRVIDPKDATFDGTSSDSAHTLTWQFPSLSANTPHAVTFVAEPNEQLTHIATILPVAFSWTAQEITTTNATHADVEVHVE